MTQIEQELVISIEDRVAVSAALAGMVDEYVRNAYPPEIKYDVFNLMEVKNDVK